MVDAVREEVAFDHVGRMEPCAGPRPGSTVSYLADPWGNLIGVIDRV